MKKEKIEIFKILRYICLSVILIFGLMTIVGTGGGGGGDGEKPIEDGPTLPVAGEWGGISGFGEIELVVTPDSTGIESIVITFNDFSCGNTISNGSITFTGSWPISNGEFTADLDWTGTAGDREMNIMGTFDDSGTYVSGTYEADYDGAICAGIWDASPENNDNGDGPTLPVAGEWGGISGFGEIELVVTPDSTGIESIVITFNDFSCGNTISNGSITFTGSWPISNGEFTADLDWTGTAGDREMNIMGTFDDSGTYVSGTYEADHDGTICAGIWDASPE